MVSCVIFSVQISIEKKIKIIILFQCIKNCTYYQMLRYIKYFSRYLRKGYYLYCNGYDSVGNTKNILHNNPTCIKQFRGYRLYSSQYCIVTITVHIVIGYFTISIQYCICIGYYQYCYEYNTDGKLCHFFITNFYRKKIKVIILFQCIKHCTYYQILRYIKYFSRYLRKGYYLYCNGYDSVGNPRNILHNNPTCIKQFRGYRLYSNQYCIVTITIHIVIRYFTISIQYCICMGYYQYCYGYNTDGQLYNILLYPHNIVFAWVTINIVINTIQMVTCKIIY